MSTAEWTFNGHSGLFAPLLVILKCSNVVGLLVCLLLLLLCVCVCFHFLIRTVVFFFVCFFIVIVCQQWPKISNKFYSISNILPATFGKSTLSTNFLNDHTLSEILNPALNSVHFVNIVPATFSRHLFLRFLIAVSFDCSIV